MARPLVVLLASAAALLLAGCSDPLPEPADETARPEAAASTGGVVPWRLVGCAYLIGFVPVADALLVPRLPAGFEPASILPAGPAVLGVEVFACDDGGGADGRLLGQPLGYGSVFTAVTPPEDLRVEGIDTYWVKWDTLVPDAPRRAVLSEAGLPVHDGSTTLTEGPLPGQVTACLTLAGLGDFCVNGEHPQPEQANPGGPFAEFTPTTSGLARWTALATDSASRLGAGTVSVPVGSFAAEVMGAPVMPAMTGAGRWSFEGNVTLAVR